MQLVSVSVGLSRAMTVIRSPQPVITTRRPAAVSTSLAAPRAVLAVLFYMASELAR